MFLSRSEIDRADPGARAADRLDQLRRGDRRWRVTAALTLSAAAIAAPLVAAPVTGDPGATIGAIVAAVMLATLAVAVWPSAWSDEERRHHELSCIWSEARADADHRVVWTRFVAWAEPDDGRVELQLISWEPNAAPSPFRRGRVQSVDADDIEAAAEAMEELRATAALREHLAQEQYESGLARVDQEAHAARVQAFETAAADELRASEDEMLREIAAREAADRRSQAEAVARALRRP